MLHVEYPEVSRLTLVRFLVHTAGTFMAGSIRWKKVDSLQVRFDIVTYWTKSASIYNNPQPGQEELVALTAQNTVQFDPGDGSPAKYLKGNVTDVSNEEDWFSAVSVVYHTYPQVLCRFLYCACGHVPNVRRCAKWDSRGVCFPPCHRPVAAAFITNASVCTAVSPAHLLLPVTHPRPLSSSHGRAACRSPTTRRPPTEDRCASIPPIA